MSDGVSDSDSRSDRDADVVANLAAVRERIRAAYLRPAAQRPPSTARGLHHTALISSDVERTIEFYQGVLGFPLTELIENRDYPGSSHFFFDIGNGNLLAFFDFPGLDLGPYAEVLGGLHHLAVSVEPATWRRLRDKLSAAGVEYQEESGTSIYFRDPDGARGLGSPEPPRDFPVGGRRPEGDAEDLEPDGPVEGAADEVDRPRHLARLPAEIDPDGLGVAGETGGVLDEPRAGKTQGTPAEELARVLPVVEALVAETDTPISVDTTKAAVARRALQAGAAMINDVSALQADSAMAAVVAEARPSQR